MDMLKTEMRNPKTTHLDRMTTTEMLRVIQDENMNAVKAVDGCLDAVGRAVDAVTEALRRGGRLIYVGAGTGPQGGLAFSTHPRRVPRSASRKARSSA